MKKSLLVMVRVILILSIVATTYLFSGTVASGATEKVLGVPWEFQHKDTNMLCLEGCPESGNNAWDAPHLDHAVHGNTYCARAATAMIANYFLVKHGKSGQLSQDRISYEMWRTKGYPVDYAFKHGGFGSHSLDWALNAATDTYTGPSFSDIKGWIDASRPMAVAWGGHYRVIDGYREDASGQFVHLLDPWPLTEPANKWVKYSDIPNDFGCYVAPINAPGVRSDESEIWMDTDGDGIVDFDETQRFGTDPNDADTDDDGVLDKQDIREYVFDKDGNYGPPEFLQRMRDELISEYPLMTDGEYVVLVHLTPGHPICPYTNLDLETGANIGWHENVPVTEKIAGRADFDGDGLRKELDPDNDDDGLLDGDEDLNHNGIFEPELGETNNFNPDTIAPTTSKTVGTPQYTDGGKLFIRSSTEHTLLAGDTGPSNYTGVLATYYRYYPEGTLPLAYLIYTSPFVITGADGPYVIEYYSKDIAGNTEVAQSQIEYLDDMPPTTSLTIGQPKWTDGTVCVTPDTGFTLQANDGTGSGVSSTEYRIHNDTYDSGWLVYTATFDLASVDAGTYTIAYRSTDNVGNVEATQDIEVKRALGVNIDTKPGSDRNPLYLGSRGRIPVAILTDEVFDATYVDPDTVRFAPDRVSPVHNALEDADGDADIDMILHFRMQDTGITPAHPEVMLTGETYDGIAIFGIDYIVVVPTG